MDNIFSLYNKYCKYNILNKYDIDIEQYNILFPCPEISTLHNEGCKVRSEAACDDYLVMYKMPQVTLLCKSD